MLVDIALLTLLGVGHDATGQGACYLAHQHIFTVGGGNHDVGMLILLTGLWEPGLVVVAVLMMNKLHFSVDRKPVGMHVQRTHEDRNHQTLIVEIFVFLGFLHYHNLAVGRRHDQFLRITIVIADRTAVEVQSHQPGCAEDDDEDPKRYGGAE